MNTIDKIRADIVRRITDNTFGAKLELMDILSFLDTLEETNFPTTDEEMEKFLATHQKVEVPDKYKTSDFVFKNLEKSEPIEGLDEAADSHIRKVADAAGHPGWDWETQDIADAFKAGAEWQKAKMMEGTVEGEVVKDISNKLAVTAKNINLDGLKFGDKVRVIIMKEEEQ